jgi:hypothetical protein
LTGEGSELTEPPSEVPLTATATSTRPIICGCALAVVSTARSDESSEMDPRKNGDRAGFTRCTLAAGAGAAPSVRAGIVSARTRGDGGVCVWVGGWVGGWGVMGC